MSARATPTIAVLLALSVQLGCGGGQDEGARRGADAGMSAATAATTVSAAATVTAATATTVTSVQLEGCLVDRHFIPAEGRVEALQADGRPVAHGDADARGRFRLRVPADTALRVRMAGREGSDVLKVQVPRQDLSVADCLIDEAQG